MANTSVLHEFLVRSGQVYRGRIESETETDLVLDIGEVTPSIVRLAKNYIVRCDGEVYPAGVVVAPRTSAEPLLLIDESTFANQILWVILFFESPLSEEERAAVLAKVPPPLLDTPAWCESNVFVATSDEHFQLDVRIAYNDEAKTLFAENQVPRFDADRYSILVDAGIDDDPDDSEMEAFGEDIEALLRFAHSTDKLSLGFVSFAAPFPKLETLARAHAEEARGAAFAELIRSWTSQAEPCDARSRALRDEVTFTVLSALREEQLRFNESDRKQARELFARIGDDEMNQMRIDGWQSMM